MISNTGNRNKSYSGDFIRSEHLNWHIHPQIYDDVKQLQLTPFLKCHYLKSKLFILSFFYKLRVGLKGFFSVPNNLEQLKSAASQSRCVSQSINRTISWASYFPSFNILKIKLQAQGSQSQRWYWSLASFTLWNEYWLRSKSIPSLYGEQPKYCSFSAAALYSEIKISTTAFTAKGLCWWALLCSCTLGTANKSHDSRWDLSQATLFPIDIVFWCWQLKATVLIN